MGMFFALIGVASVLNLPVLLFAVIVEWFYSFFHVHNLAGLTDEEFLAVEDGFLFRLDAFFGTDGKVVEKYRKTIAVVLVVVGVLLLWNGGSGMALYPAYGAYRAENRDGNRNHCRRLLHDPGKT